MINVGFYFGRKFQCPLCNTKNDTQIHLLDCLFLQLEIPQNQNITYMDIFGSNIEKINLVCEQLEKAYRKRQEFL